MSIGLGLCLSMCLSLGSQVLGLRLCFCLGVCMHSGLGLQVLSLCLSFQALCVGSQALCLGCNLHVPRLGDSLIALSMQVLSMSLHMQAQKSLSGKVLDTRGSNAIERVEQIWQLRAIAAFTGIMQM